MQLRKCRDTNNINNRPCLIIGYVKTFSVLKLRLRFVLESFTTKILSIMLYLFLIFYKL